MRIQHNIMAMSAYRNYTNNVSAMKKNLEKLSSGYKINRAGDDAAGLAISEKMRAQITGLETAQKNAKDGISLVQTAEGALTEVHDMLNRMVELATMSANGTYDNTTDRAQLQKEMDQLRSEIDRIADSSNFNGIKLLNGNMDGSDTVTEAAVEGVAVTAVLDGDQSGVAGTVGVYHIDLKDVIGFNGSAGTAMTISITINGTLVATITGAGATVGVSDSISLAVTQITVDGLTYNIGVSGDKITLTGVSVPSTSASFNTALTVSAGAVDADGGTAMNAGVDFSVHVDTAPQVDSKKLLAHGQFTLNKADIADGAKLKIGENTYVFAVGSDSTAKAGNGETLIDLKGIDADDDNLLRYAVEKLTQQDNSMFHITTGNLADKPTSVVIDLTEKEGAVDYKKDWNLKGDDSTTPATNNGEWNKKVGSDDATTGVVTKQAAPVTTPGDPTKGLTLQIGDTADSYNQLKVDIKDIHCKAMGIDASKLSIADQTSAAAAIEDLKKSINYVSDVRGTLGATQNRLDHTINNLSVMTENIQDAESTIRDTDVAEEMMAYTKNNILIQSAQAMLAQANQVPQGVLQLLQ